MRKRSLIAEDQEELRDLLAGSGNTVVEAADGQAVVASAKSKGFDLNLMDTQLPVVDAYQAIRQIEADPTLAKTPIIAVSSFAMKGDEEKAWAAGRDHHLSRPYSPLQLRRSTRGVLGEQG